MDANFFQKHSTTVSTLLKALSNEKRFHIACVLYDGERAVGELEKIVGLSQSALSQHLARLRRDKIVETRREAQTIYYSLANTSVEKILSSLCNIIDDPCEEKA
ncbi:MAG: winged helix-turn-helix transcriptional regulator [Alphaproteobacteria bacterium]|nr:winged helix-turn-helix transcriptional regulator [Alphaproteobacteria bacterium]